MAIGSPLIASERHDDCDIARSRPISPDLVQMILGIFDYAELEASNHILAPLLFTTFVVLVVLILMNIFLAILNDAFSVVSERQKRAQNLGGLFKAIWYKKVSAND